MNHTVILSEDEFHSIQYKALQEEYPKLRAQLVDLMNENSDLKEEIKRLKWAATHQD